MRNMTTSGRKWWRKSLSTAGLAAVPTMAALALAMTGCAGQQATTQTGDDGGGSGTGTSA